MKDKGFIMLSRKLFSHRIWRAARTFSECEAWIDLIQSARFEATVTIERIGGRDITYGRGQFPASISFLSDRWGWPSAKKVRNFLDMLKKEGMITTDCTQGMNIITLCKYDEYNSVENVSGKPKGKGEGIDIIQEINGLKLIVGELRASQRAKEGQGRGNKNNKDNNIKNNIPPIIPPLSGDASATASAATALEGEEGKSNPPLSVEEEFEMFRKAYPGNKRGHKVEFDNFKKKHSDYKAAVYLLSPALARLNEWRDRKKQLGQFVPEYANLSTWINQRRWEVEYEKVTENNETEQKQAKRYDDGDFLR